MNDFDKGVSTVRKWRRNWVLVIAVAVFVLGFAVIILFDYIASTDADLPGDFVLESEALERKRNELNVELQSVDRLVRAEIGCGSFCSVLIDSPHFAAYEYLYPKMKDPAGDGSVAPVTGIIAISPDRMPGSDEMLEREERKKYMTVEQFKELLHEGWSFTFRYSEAGVPIADFLAECRAAALTIGIDLGDSENEYYDRYDNTIYFDYDCYSLTIDGELGECGIPYAIHHGEDRIFCIEENYNEPLLRPGATGWNTFGLSTGLVPELVHEGGYSIISMGFDKGYTSFFEWDYFRAVESFGRMIDRFVEYREDGMLVFGGVAANFAERRAYMEEYERRKPEIAEREAAIEAEIKKVDLELIELHHKYFD